MFEGKINIRNCGLDEIYDFLESVDEKRFRANQIFDWIWKKGVNNFSQMQNLSANLRMQLSDKYYIDAINVIQEQTSSDKTTKILFESILNDKFEGVLIPSKDRVTACISTQVGCALNCDFCATGKIGFVRNLSIGEIFEQVFLLNELSHKKFDRQLSNIVIMGMGEPLLNLDNTIAAIDKISSDKGLGFSPQRITLSTAGISPKIKELADINPKFNLSISLHSANNEKRSAIMPINKKYDLNSLQDALSYFYKKTGKRVTYEYLMLDNINDTAHDASMLTAFTKISACKINLIEYNPTENDKFKASSQISTNKFIEYLESKNLIVTLRRSKGKDINAACGQLANKDKKGREK